MLTAFRAQPIIDLKPKDKSKVDSLLAYGDRIILGLSSGAIRTYRVPEPQVVPADQDEAAASPQNATAQLVHEEDKFSKRPVQQLAIIKEANVLVSLSDAHVSLHDLHTYALQDRLLETKGASSFAVTSNVVKDLDSQVPALVSRLAVAVKRRIMLWTWQDTELTAKVGEIAIPSTVKSIAWCSNTVVVVGMDPGFSLVNVETSTVTDINKPDPSATDAGVRDGGARFGAVNTTGMGYVGLSAWVPKPMITTLANGQILLAKDVNTLYVDQGAKALEKRQIPWSLPPEAINFSYPYLISLQQSTKGVCDVRNPDTNTLLQSIPIANATILHVPPSTTSLAHAGKGFLVASDRCVWRMLAVDYESQIDELVAKSRYDEAVSLLSLLEDSLLADKQSLLREVQTKKAQALFEKRKYQPAMDLLAEAGAAPAKVITLYPKSIAGDLLLNPDGVAQDQRESVDKAAQLDETHKEIMSTSPETAKITESQSAMEDTNHFDDPDELKTAVIALCGFLAQSRVQAQKYINTDGSLKAEVSVRRSSDALNIPYRNLIPLDRGADLTMIDWQAELYRAANLIDTTLFRAYMHARPQLAGPLFRLENFCDPHVVEEKLYESGRYTDLVDFLHGKKLHRQALELLEKFGRNDAAEEVMPALRGPNRTIGYLQQLPPENIDLILEFAKWPLQTQKESGMQVFLADTENAEQLSRHRVVPFLESVDSDLATMYLEHIVIELNDQDAEFHQSLVDRYIAQLLAFSSTIDNHGRSKKPDIQRKLETFLRSSTQFNKGRTFWQLPASNPDFFESRAIVLSAMGNHKQALSIYVFQLKDYVKAEEYCHEQLHHSPSQPAAQTHSAPSPGEEMYTVLLSLYLRPPQDQQTNWPQALDLLSKHGARLPASETLDLAPDDLALSDLAAYFQGRIRSDNSTLNTGRVQVGLENARRTRLECDLAGGRAGAGSGQEWAAMAKGPGRGSDGGGGRARKVVIREDSHCKVCLRRFGNSAIRVFPDNRVVHYGCVGRGD